MKRYFSFLIALMLILSGFASVPAFAENPDIKIEGEAALLMDMSTGKVFYSKNADEKHWPASTTKMLTAVLAIENLDLNKVLTMDDEVHAAGGSVIGLKNGEKISVKDLLYSMLVRSANDCAIGLAKAVSGSVSAFADLMNQKAKELGCTGTHFVNPNGLHDEGQYTTASDLAKIAVYCMKNEVFRDAVSNSFYTIPPTNICDEERTYVTTNLLLNDEKKENMIYVGNELRFCKYEGCMGIKTGYTSEAGGCLVAAAEKNGTALLCVVLKSSHLGRFADSIKLLDYGFGSYRTVSVMEKGKDLGFVKVKRGAVNKVKVELAEKIEATLPSEASDDVITTEISIDKSVKAPIPAGTAVGSVTVFESGIEAGKYNIITSEAVEKGGMLSIFGISDKAAKILLFLVLGIILALAAALFIWIAYMKRQMKIKKARRDAKLKAKREAEAKKRAEWEAEYEKLRYTRSGDDFGD